MLLFKSIYQTFERKVSAGVPVSLDPIFLSGKVELASISNIFLPNLNLD